MWLLSAARREAFAAATAATLFPKGWDRHPWLSFGDYHGGEHLWVEAAPSTTDFANWRDACRRWVEAQLKGGRCPEAVRADLQCMASPNEPGRSNTDKATALPRRPGPARAGGLWHLAARTPARARHRAAAGAGAAPCRPSSCRSPSSSRSRCGP